VEASWQRTMEQIEELVTRPADEREEAVVRVRSLDADADVRYLGQASTPYSASARVERYRTSSRTYSVDIQTNQIVEIYPLQTEFDTAPHHSPAELEQMARVFVSQADGDLDLGALELKIGSKGGAYHFFRWTAAGADRADRSTPFVQVGFSSGGDLLSYVNTLELPQQQASTFNEYYANGGLYWDWLLGSYIVQPDAGYCHIYGWCNPKDFYYAPACLSGTTCDVARGRWVPNRSYAYTEVDAFIPSTHATATACYVVHYNGGSSSFKTCINQNFYSNQFAVLTSGAYDVQRIALNNVVQSGGGEIAWDEIHVFQQ
jgi:hypothetical protein